MRPRDHLLIWNWRDGAWHIGHKHLRTALANHHRFVYARVTALRHCAHGLTVERLQEQVT
jgi:hypothetical protein